MNIWSGGYGTGLAIGFIIGMAAGRNQKPWSEYSSKEKREKIAYIIFVLVVFILGSYLYSFIN